MATPLLSGCGLRFLVVFGASLMEEVFTRLPVLAHDLHAPSPTTPALLYTGSLLCCAVLFCCLLVLFCG
jgi:hypothetical protein